MKTKETLYLYVRVSTDEQKEKDLSPARQKELGIQVAKEQGMDYQILEDEGESASYDNFDNRPKMIELLRLVKEGAVKHLFVFDQSRLSRNNITKAVILEALRKQKVQLYTHSKRFDFNKEEDVLTMRILEAIETYESALRKARFQLGYVTANKRGRFLKGIPPLGYKKDEGGILIVDEEERAIYLLIVQLYLKGENPNDSLSKPLGTNQIADYLNSKGVPTKGSKYMKNGYVLRKGIRNRKSDNHKYSLFWNPGTILSILKNEMYTGKRRFKVGPEKFEFVDVEPLIDKETYSAIQERRAKNVITRKKEDKYFYLLKGLLVCGNCGSPMHGRVKPNRGEFTYKCNSKRLATHVRNETQEKTSLCQSRGINIKRLNTLAWNAFKTSLYYHKLVNATIETQIKKGENNTFSIESLQKEMIRLEKEEDTIQSAIKELVKKELDKRIPSHVYEELLSDYNEKLKLISDNKITCNLNIRKLAEKEKQMKSLITDLSLGISYFGNAQLEIEKIINSEDKANQLKARSLIYSAIAEISVTFVNETQSHKVEIVFSQLKEASSLPQGAVLQAEGVRKTYNVHMNQVVDPIILPILDTQRFLNFSEIGAKSKKGPRAKKNMPKLMPPFQTQRQMWLSLVAAIILSPEKFLWRTMVFCF